MTGLAPSLADYSLATRAARSSPGGLIGESQPMQHMLRLMDRVAATDSSLLITGESGTGKERVSRAIRRRMAQTLGWDGTAERS